MINTFPTLEEVEKASHLQICRWWRFLRSGENAEEYKIQAKIAMRYKELGGMTPEISKKLGWMQF